MTNNQVAYWKLQEEKNANQIKRDTLNEEIRKNKAYENWETKAQKADSLMDWWKTVGNMLTNFGKMVL